MPSSAEQSQGLSDLGDYRLEEPLSEGTRTLTYRAEQISMSRAVVLERIKPADTADQEVVEQFLADVRAKAGVDHPGIGSVYEGVQDQDAVYYTREFLQGETFEDLHDGKVTFEPRTMVTFLRQIATAMEYLQQRKIATLPLEPRHLVCSEHEVVRIVNLAVAEWVASAEDGHDRHLVAELFLDLLRRGTPGARRVSTLLSTMADQGGTALSWSEVANTTRKLEQELSEGAKVASQAIETGPIEEGPPRRPRLKAAFGVLVGVLAVAALGAGGFLLITRKSAPEARNLGAMIEIPGGLSHAHDGKQVELKRFWIDAHEVTIAEYAQFLAALAQLPEDKRSGYDHRDQPSLKLDHIPDDWEATLSAARSGVPLEGLRLTLNDPVTRIDWWDAQAYANWKGGRLPTQDEWLAAAGQATVEPSGRGPVDSFPEDVTPEGIHGLAGNVSEWVRDSARNPAFPMNPTSPVACGASSLQPRDGVRARTWLPSRQVRRRDLGFRIVRGAAP